MIQVNHPRFSCTSDMSLTIYGIILSGPLMHTHTPSGTGVHEYTLVYKDSASNMILYLRNLLTHTVNKLLQKLNNVKSIQFLLLNKYSVLFTSCVKFSQHYLGYYAKYSVFNLKGSKSEVTKIAI